MGDRPTYGNLEQSLINARRICLEQNITTLAIPKIRCGLDRLEWFKVETLVNKIFVESTIPVKVYTRPNEDVVVDSDRTDGT